MNSVNLKCFFRVNRVIRIKELTRLLLVYVEMAVSRASQPGDCNSWIMFIFGEKIFIINNLYIEQVNVLK